jgi:multicomponent Na+:H+ antiporter subunit E
MMLTWNILLALIWMACWGETVPSQFFVGFVMGFAILRFSERAGILEKSSYTSRFLCAIGLFFYFLSELWKSNIRVAKDVLRPNPRVTPGIVAVPIDLKNDWAITLLANLITLTPGTLSLDLSRDKKTLYIHTLYLDNSDKEAFVASIRGGFESRIRFLEGSV